MTGLLLISQYQVYSPAIPKPCKIYLASYS